MDFWDKFRLAMTLYAKMAAPVAKQFDLTQTELDILMFLYRYPERDSATDIVKNNGISKSNVSAALRDLVDRGLIETYYSENNHRTIHLSLCPSSDRVIRMGQEMHEEWVRMFFKDFTEEEKETFIVLFHRVLDNAITETNNLDPAE